MSEVEKPKAKGIWSPVPKYIRRLILSQVLNSFTFGYFLIYVTSFLPEQGYSPFVVATFIGLEGIVVVTLGIPFAILSDLRGRKWFLVLGNVIFAPTILIFALTKDLSLLYIAAATGGLGEALGLSSWNAMIADQTEIGNRDSAFALLFILGTASFSAGAGLPLAFPWLASTLALSSESIHVGALALLGAANLATPLILVYLLKDYKDKVLKRWKFDFHGMGNMLKFSFINSSIAFGAGLIIPLLATWLLVKFAITDTYAGPYLALSGLTIAFSAIFSPRISARLGLFRAILATAGSSTVFMFAMALAPNVYLAGGIYLARAGLMNMNSPLMDSYLMGITSTEKRGLASMLNAVIWRIPNNASTFIGGFLLDPKQGGLNLLGLAHYDIPWALASVFYVAGIAALYLTFRHVKPSS